MTASLWSDTSLPVFATPPPAEADVLVIGAGITGLTCAIELTRDGRRVTVIDDGPIGGGETGRTSAHLASAVDDRYYELESKFGKEGARLVAESHGAAIDYIVKLVTERR
ncbi:MAG: FAD-binding oxidoreductase, partial [Kofleriaceae bacterium]